MCLESVDLKLMYDKQEKDYVGVGYKKIRCLDSTLRLNHSVIESCYKPFNKWLSVKKDWNGAPLHKSHISFDGLDFDYHPGYHIFLNEKDAFDYVCLYGYSCVVKVLFKDVLAYGQNQTLARIAPCVVTKSIKILGRV